MKLDCHLKLLPIICNRQTFTSMYLNLHTYLYIRRDIQAYISHRYYTYIFLFQSRYNEAGVPSDASDVTFLSHTSSTSVDRKHVDIQLLPLYKPRAHKLYL